MDEAYDLIMTFKRGPLLFTVHSALTIVGNSYVWPSPILDRTESIMFQQSGLLREGLVDGVNPCSFGTNVEGRQNAAEWVCSQPSLSCRDLHF